MEMYTHCQYLIDMIFLGLFKIFSQLSVKVSITLTTLALPYYPRPHPQAEQQTILHY